MRLRIIHCCHSAWWSEHFRIQLQSDEKIACWCAPQQGFGERCSKIRCPLQISGLGNMQLLRRSGKIVHDIRHSTWWRWRQVDKCLCDSVRQTAQVLECVADIEVSQIGNIHFSTRVMNVPTESSTLLRGLRALCRTTALGIVDTLDKVFAHGIPVQSFLLRRGHPDHPLCL